MMVRQQQGGFTFAIKNLPPRTRLEEEASPVYAAMRAVAPKHPTTVPVDLIETHGNEILPLASSAAIQSAMRENFRHITGPVFLETLEIDDSNFVEIIRAAARQRLVDHNPEPITLMFSPMVEPVWMGLRRIGRLFDGLPNVKIQSWRRRSEGPRDFARFMGLNVAHAKTMTFFHKDEAGDIVDAESIVWDGNLQAKSDPIGTSAKAAGWQQAGVRIRGPASLAAYAQLVEGLGHARGSDSELPSVVSAKVRPGGASILSLGQASAVPGGVTSLKEALIAGYNAAKHDIYENVSNLNDQRIIDTLAAATHRGVHVHVLTNAKFNQQLEFVYGGSNKSGLARLRKQSNGPFLEELLNVSPDGVVTNGNGPYANHDKFTIIDGEAVILRSAPLDLQGRRSREYGIATDDRQTVAYFMDVWKRRPKVKSKNSP
jgi:hypothetical protein